MTLFSLLVKIKIFLYKILDNYAAVCYNIYVNAPDTEIFIEVKAANS